MKILICGSRYISDKGLKYARRVVQRAKELGATIIVGDNPQGVDAAVIDEADRLKYTVAVYGAYGKFRKQSKFCTGVRTGGSYSARDRMMVNSLGDNDIVLCIWNGKSSGTYSVFQYAKTKTTLKVYLRKF